jgi:hypothetical protein
MDKSSPSSKEIFCLVEGNFQASFYMVVVVSVATIIVRSHRSSLKFPLYNHIFHLILAYEFISLTLLKDQETVSLQND